jgi:predicted nucleic acid-binding Zn finger protein
MTLQAVIALSEEEATLVSRQSVHSGHDLTIQNLSATAYVYIGNENVSTTQYGFRINPDTAFSVELDGKDELWAVTSDEGSQVAVLSLSLEN